ncbi:hypothetical protein M427DRAFT_52341 [Gonapodya prolifera JEL478]|uniref:Acyl-CoA thioesterase-like N-terminal HotDog domain-containing protein n=1 Tax=Gonapodya prolifera (strain JEL478) TaxID=1344416 RepID=A0A139AU28_GONPJ|nr:hypothetical protein M427DRAFT_52341 [Gonapodya prolifera JEL478]|eukprot:KXS20083.1 hypothetical protein M427DRAFT_52341 [Gonapodya prolifera JEL478]
MASAAFDAHFHIAPVLSKSAGGVFAFRTTTPREMGGGGNRESAMFGGYLMALVTKAALTVANARGYPHVMTVNLDILSSVSVGEELEITVEVLRTSRRLCFVRTSTVATASSSLVLVSQSTCGFLEATNPSAVFQRTTTSFDLSRLKSAAPSLTSPAAALGTLHALVSSIYAPSSGTLTSQFLHAEVSLYSSEAAQYGQIALERRGVAGIARELWGAVDDMPSIVVRPDGQPIDTVSAAFLSDINPPSFTLSTFFGPAIISVTVSVALTFLKPVPPGTTWMYMAARIIASDTPRSLDGASVEGGAPTELGAVAHSEAALWAPDGTLVCMQRQTRVVAGKAMPRLEGLSRGGVRGVSSTSSLL